MTKTWLLVVGTLAACGSNRMMGDGGGDDTGSNSDVTAVALPQTVGGAFFVDPAVYQTIPVHVAVAGNAKHVSISLDAATSASTPASLDAGSETAWTAMVPVGALTDGDHALVVDADGTQATATLVAGSQDAQFTDFNVDMTAATPRLHRSGDHLFMTWSDISTGTRVAWLQEIDGAARRIGTPVALVGGAGEEDVLYARTAFGAKNIAVLYQQRGGPYDNFFTIVNPDGSAQLVAMPIDPAGRFGSNGGDVVYDGSSGFDVTWLTNDGMGNADVRWMHVDETTGAIVGPIIAADTGNDMPDAGFDPITNVAITHSGDASLVAFLRYRHDATLDQDIARCQVATIKNGAVASVDLAGIGDGFFWDDDCRILDDGTGPVVVWARKDLTSSDDNPPDVFAGARDPSGLLASTRDNGAVMVNAPESREEPWIVATSAAPVLAWTDSRSYNNPNGTGQVQLYAAAIAPDLSTSGELLFPATHFVEGTGEVHGAAAGTNAILTWLDERHGGSVVAPKPEVYLETVWQ